MKHAHSYSPKKADELWQAVLGLKTKSECAKFFRDLCTIEELKAIVDRWQAVKMINKGVPYREIAKKLDMSSTTVSRVAQWLNNGKGGYKLILKRLKLL
ncbi:MAG: YerC/YecD family TrpR-related protein [Candidatus Komeilibacteria bacterium]|nr:YerC/YecD family TrpR-related protein [Candidatus Komeilibacteria bacterium]